LSISKDDVFMEMANVISKLSKDESTKLGAIVIGPDNEIRSAGYNSFPMGVRDDIKERQERPNKYFYFSHAENNAIVLAARTEVSLKNCRMYVPWPPCSSCAINIIQSGIKEIIIQNVTMPKRWWEDFQIGITMLIEAGITIRQPNSNVSLDNSDFIKGK